MAALTRHVPNDSDVRSELIIDTNAEATLLHTSEGALPIESPTNEISPQDEQTGHQ